MFRKSFFAALFILMLGFNYSSAQTQLIGPEKPDKKEDKKDSVEKKKQEFTDYGITNEKSPAMWIQSASNIINDLLLKSVEKYDTTKWNTEMDNFSQESNLLLQDIIWMKDKNLSIKEIKEIKSRLLGLKTKLQVITEDIKKISNKIIERYNLASKINEESFDKVISKDTALKRVFNDEFKSLLESAEQLKSLNLDQMKSLTVRENKKNESAVLLAVLIESIDQRKAQWQEKAMSQDEPEIWNLFGKDYPATMDVARRSFDFVYNSFSYYFQNSWKKRMTVNLLISVLLIIYIFYLFNFKLKKKLDDYGKIKLEYIAEFPWLITFGFLMIALPIVLVYPPVVITQLILLVLMILVSVIMYKRFIGQDLLIPFLIVFAFYFIVKIDDFILEVTIFERLFYLLSIIPVIFLGRYFFKHLNVEGSKSMFGLILIVFLIVHFLAGFILNIIGWVTMSKIIISAGVRGYYLAVLLWIGVFVIMDYIYILSSYFDKINKAFEVNLSRIRTKITLMLAFFASVFWIYMYLDYLYVDSYVFAFLTDVVMQQRTIGSATFSIGSILIFVMILFFAFYIAGMIKQIIEVNDFSSQEIQRSNIGSFLLIMRLTVIAFGFLLALMASGIPLDTIAILISALSVGIGFGLQNIINNLVSGVIIAVERPFKVGDIVNYGGVDGMVKNIGVRSSVITSEDGSELIIPNGDLISKNLINWTSNNKFRKENLVIEVKSGATDEQFNKFINEALESPDLKDKVAGLQINLISTGNEIQKWSLSFWVTDMVIHQQIKSAVIKNVNERLHKENIEVKSFASI